MFFFSEGDSVVSFHVTSETVDELPNLAAVHETYIVQAMSFYE